ncbi:MAG: FAD-dependent monooxygenase, partial [Cytophagaceae bacterium]
SMFALGNSQALIAQRNGYSHIRVYAALSVTEENITMKIDTASPESARASLAVLFSGWSKTMVDLILQGSTFRAWPLYALPVGHRWEHRRGLTLIGDAAHLMSPFGGHGANLAMLEGAELGLSIAASGDWDRSIRSFEQKAVARAEEAARQAERGVAAILLPNALEHSLKWMKEGQGK